MKLKRIAQQCQQALQSMRQQKQMMAFTPPATYASEANTGYLAIFELGDNASPPNYTAIAEIKSFTLPLISMAEVPTTHLLSPNNTEEFIPSMIKPGKISGDGEFHR